MFSCTKHDVPFNIRIDVVNVDPRHVVHVLNAGFEVQNLHFPLEKKSRKCGVCKANDKKFNIR